MGADSADCRQPSRKGLRMLRMPLPIFQILRCRSLVLDDEHVLRVFGFCALGKVKTAGNHDGRVNDHDLVMGDSVLSINLNKDASGFA